MRRLFLTNRSPYARKVELQLGRRGLPYDRALVDLANRSPEFVAVSPVGKVPVLQDEDGTVVFDSTVICEYLADRHGGLPAAWADRLAWRQLDELGDSLCDQAIAIFFAKQANNPNEKATRVGERLLAELESRAPAPGQPFGPGWGWGDDAVHAALGYWGFRFGDGWREGRPKLAAWFDAADATPEAIATRPRG